LLEIEGVTVGFALIEREISRKPYISSCSICIKTLNNTQQKNLTGQKILDAITFSRDLFGFIASNNNHDGTSSDTLNLSRKRYYNKLSKLIKLDLIKRESGRYILTPFGTVIYEVQLGFGKAVIDHLKIKNTQIEN
jgi:hypothetical protein